MANSNPWPIGGGSNNYHLVAESVLLRDMCSHIHIHLTEYKRGTDLRLFEFYTSLHKTTDPLHVSINKARAAYPVRAKTPFDYDTILCLSHANRKICNARLNEHKACLAEASGKTMCHLQWEGDGIKRGDL